MPETNVDKHSPISSYTEKDQYFRPNWEFIPNYHEKSSV